MNTGISSQHKNWSLTFQVTEKLVEEFARLTGDFSSQHMDERRARTSAYHQRVVHGMLSVSALFLLEPFLNSTSKVIKKISGRFLFPVYIGDTVSVELKQEQENKSHIDEQRFMFHIKASSVGEAVSYGEIIIGSLGNESLNQSLPELVGNSFLESPLEENPLEFSEVIKGQSEAIVFNAHPVALLGWFNELRKNIIGIDAKVKESSGPLEIIVVMLCSTLVGMRLPGRRATFLDFSLEFTQPVMANASYTLKASVDFISKSTSMIIEKLEILKGGLPGSVQGKGKISVKMDEPSIVLPNYKDLSSQLSDKSLQGKVVIITGASRGIGATTARLFACHGAGVVVNYLTSELEANKVVADILNHGAKAIAIKADVSHRDQVKALVAKTVEVFGGVDILVNNAVTDFIATPFQSLTWEKVQQDIDVILRGAFNCSQEVIPQMIKKGGGRIINIVTTATENPPVGHSKYVMAKSALIGLSRSLAVEFAGRNILVNMVMPSMVETDLTKSIPAAVRDKIRSSYPLGRHPTTLDVAKAVVALSGSSSDFTTGQKVFITGGLPPFI